MALIVGVDDVLGGTAEVRHRGEKAGPVVRLGDLQRGELEDGGIVEGPAQGERAGLTFECGGEDWGQGVAVAGRENVQGLVRAVFHLDALRKVGYRLPGAVGGLELLACA